MNLELVKEYFSLLAVTQESLQNNREKLNLAKYNSYNFFKLISTKSAPQIDTLLLRQFLLSFTYNFQLKEPHQITKNVQFKLIPEVESKTMEQIMNLGIDLFLGKWGNKDKMNFQQFSLFLKDKQQLPDRTVELPYSFKKCFFELLEKEIQNLIDIDTLSKAVALQYKNIEDLFESLSCDGQINFDQLQNLYLMSGQRKPSDYIHKIQRRFSLPCNYQKFRSIFRYQPLKDKYKQQSKIFYSSLKRKKDVSYDSDRVQKFMTPSGKNAAVMNSSTKMTKAQRFNSTNRSKVCEYYGVDDPQISTRPNTAMLGDILLQEQNINELKRTLLFRDDYDLELIYQKRGKQFQELLNRRYGTCNFTSFIRFMVPLDYEHRYLAFIKHNRTNKLSQETNVLIANLVQEHNNKQSRIEDLWNQVDKDIIFRSYCQPGQKAIPNSSMKQYFTERQCKLLLDRFDPNHIGSIALQNFK